MKLRLVFEYELPVPAPAFATVLQVLEDQLWDAELQNIAQLPAAFGQEYEFIDRHFVHACAMRLGDERGKVRRFSLVQIDSIKLGSIVVEVSVAAIALWIVKATIGESFKAAYLDSDLHRRVTKFFLLRHPDTLQWAVDGLRHVLKLRNSGARVETVRKITPHQGPHWLIVEVKIEKPPQTPPTYSQVTDEFNNQIGGS